MFEKILSMGAVAALALAGSAWGGHYPDPSNGTGPIFYVDATHGATGNTELAAGGMWDFGSGLTNIAFTPRPGPWRWLPFVNFQHPPAPTEYGQGSVYQNLDIEQEMPTGPDGAVERLVTTITGLIPDEAYYVYVYFWTDTSSWRIRASFDNSAGPLPLFAANDGAGNYMESPFSGPVHNLGPEDVNVSEIDNQVPGGIQYFDPLAWPNDGLLYSPVSVADGNRRLMEGFLGVRPANSDGEIQVYIDDDDYNSLVGIPGFGSTPDSSFRTWYDGVGYTLVPEPGTVGLMGVGGMMMLCRRRKWRQ